MSKIFLFLLAIVLLGCGETSEKQLLGDFYIRYLQEDGSIKAQAKFKQFSEKQEEWYYPETGVSFMDFPMNLKEMNGVTDDFYEYIGRKPLQPEMLFKFVNTKLIQVKQKVTYDNISNLRIKEGEIKVDSGFTLIWDGATLQENDELSLMVESEEGQVHKISYSGATNSNELKYIPEQVEKFPKGKVKISPMRMHFKRFSETSEVQGAFTIEYYFKPFEVKVL
jgi:hypothetical protein